MAPLVVPKALEGRGNMATRQREVEYLVKLVAKIKR
jgi:hypothetical protein